MTERERLIDLLHGSLEIAGPVVDATLNHIADYLLDNGVIVPPCKVGDTVYTPIYDSVTNERYIGDVETISEVGTKGFFICENNYYEYFEYSEIGKTVFLTREEAEKELRERET